MATQFPRGPFQSSDQNKTQNKSNPTTSMQMNKREIIVIIVISIILMIFIVLQCGGENKKVKTTQKPAAVDSSEMLSEEQKTRLEVLRRRLYVTTDSLKARSGPHKDSSLVVILPYGAELIDLGEYKNEQKMKITKDYEAVEPWVKIKTMEGKIAWVFGAGVRPYPKKRSKTATSSSDKTKDEPKSKSSEEKSKTKSKSNFRMD